LAARRRLLAGDLSGGEQQMLSLAPVLVDPPRVLISDEPTLGLAPLVVGTVLELLHEVREQGTAILLAEEKAHDVLHVADDVAFVELGRIAWSGAAGDVDSTSMTELYLGAAR
jgi:ABC-type branched-subunit amino acid transport system ATPase component